MATSSRDVRTDTGPTRHALRALAAIGGGVLLAVVPVVYGLEGLIYSVDALDVVPLSLVPATALPLLVLGVWGFSERYGPSYSRWGRWGLRALALGLLGLWPFALLGIVHVGFAVGIAVYVLALGAAVVLELGTLGVALDCWRTGTPSRRMAIWFPLALPLGTLLNYWALHLHDYLWMGNHYYAGLFGLAWIGVGYRLLRPRPSTG